MTLHHAPTPLVARHVLQASNAPCTTAVTVAASLVANFAWTRSKDALGAGARSPDRGVRTTFVCNALLETTSSCGSFYRNDFQTVDAGTTPMISRADHVAHKPRDDNRYLSTFKGTQDKRFLKMPYRMYD